MALSNSRLNSKMELLIKKTCTEVPDNKWQYVIKINESHLNLFFVRKKSRSIITLNNHHLYSSTRPQNAINITNLLTVSRANVYCHNKWEQYKHVQMTRSHCIAVLFTMKSASIFTRKVINILYFKIFGNFLKLTCCFCMISSLSTPLYLSSVSIWSVYFNWKREWTMGRIFYKNKRNTKNAMGGECFIF